MFSYVMLSRWMIKCYRIIISIRKRWCVRVKENLGMHTMGQRTYILWLMIRIWNRMVIVTMVVRLHVSPMNLSRPMPPPIVESPQLIVKMGFHRIKPILHMKNPLQTLPLTNQTPFHLIHALIAMSSSMTNQAAPST